MTVTAFFVAWITNPETALRALLAVDLDDEPASAGQDGENRDYLVPGGAGGP